MPTDTKVFEAVGIEVFDNTEANMTYDPETSYVEVEFRDPDSGIVYAAICFDPGVLGDLAEAERGLFALAAAR